VPVNPGRLVQVDDEQLNPGVRDYSVKLRFRTSRAFGNVIQKGQSGAKGGCFKVLCRRTADRVVMTIDGSKTRRAFDPTGNISNDVRLTIGGKLHCNQITTGCDYFDGDIDRVVIKAGG